MADTRYRQIYHILKSRIQQGLYATGDFLPSEHELCRSYSITRTTARKALDELLREGFIEKQHGKGSQVVERRQSLGLLTVKGFSEAVGPYVRAVFLERPLAQNWPDELPFAPSAKELEHPCYFFKRLRYVGDEPVMLESNWFSTFGMEDFHQEGFVDDSFFKTLSQKYLIEITGSEQEIRAVHATGEIADLLGIAGGSPILQISIRFATSKPHLHIYGYLYCNTSKYPIGNFYKH
ncbi:MAG: GntR family transcriptional regulator [Cyclobacteriaceae bacterium]|nr:GntR family transcriptional regulator [Cyclobacteriaceae bacterium]